MRSNQGLTPVRKTTVIGSALLVLALVVAWMFVLSPRSDAITKVNDEKVIAESANSALRNKIQTLRMREQQLPELRQVSKALDRRFPPSAQQAKLFKMITSAAAAAGIAPQYVTGLTIDPPSALASAATAQLPGVAAPVGQIAGQKVTINVSGSPSEVRSFVANLEKLPRAFAVDTIQLAATAPAAATSTTPGAAAGNVSVAPDAQTVTITGNMFVMPKVIDPLVPATSTGNSATKAG
jgi:Tfp pilus assembly protein PilO